MEEIKKGTKEWMDKEQETKEANPPLWNKRQAITQATLWIMVDTYIPYSI